MHFVYQKSEPCKTRTHWQLDGVDLQEQGNSHVGLELA